MNTHGYVLTGQRRCADASEAIALMAQWLEQPGDKRVFLNRVGEQVFVEMWKPER